MLKKLLLATVFGGLMVSSALAQAPAGAAADTSSAKFISAQSPDQWVFSKIKGSNVLDPSDQHIGDVSDLRRARADANPADKTSG